MIRLHKIIPIFVCSLLVLSVLSIASTQTSAADFEISQASDYITYFGGSLAEDATKVAFDNSGNTILIGQTSSTDLPVTSSAFQSTYGGGDWDAFIAKFSPAGDLLFSSYLGGSGYEHITVVNVDAENNMVVAGTTGSTGLPTTTGALHESHIGSFDGFVFKLAPNGTILYGTYFGGTGEDWIYGMEFDESGNYLFSGWTNSLGLATGGVHQNTFGGGIADAFIARLSEDFTTKQMFSYFGGPGDDRAWFMTIDHAYNYLLSGVASSGFPISGGAYQSVHGGGFDAYLTKISYDGATLMFSTFLGGSEDDLGTGLDVDSQHNIILTGDTQSDDISTLNAIQPTFAGGTNDFLASKFNSTGHPYFVTYIGGELTDRCWDCRVDNEDNLVLVGRTYSPDFPALNGMNDTKADGMDACALKLSSDGQTILASTFIGGNNEDIGEGIAVDGDGNVVVTGRTLSSDFPTTDGAYQEEKAGLSDVFICHTAFTPPTTPTPTTSPTTPNGGTPPDMTLILVAAGGGVVVVVVLAVVYAKRR